MSNTKKILSVLAHPDDESFGMGGTLAYYAKQGVEVHLICATKGEAGDVEPKFLKDFQSVADRRESELRCAANYLGLKKVTFLGYRDSGMDGSEDNRHPQAFINAPLEEVSGKIVAYIRDYQPDVVLTFDPVGGYRHPDHIHIQKATVAAFEAAADPGQYPEAGDPFQPKKLLYHIFPRGFVRLAVRVYKLFGKDPTKFGRNHDIDLEKLAGDDDYPVHIRINYSTVNDLKEKASNCHESQLNFSDQSPLVLRVARFLMSGTDSFMQAYPPVPDNYQRKDLFT
ncbi:MAG TPA: PIG-L family deacetylase [Anaerolineales bacterium]|jgi:LmbE family N-acetylglucosaminyl deacetylase|nr:PIG-L family deacetylase [Anaerolineales bacterium]